MLKSPIPTLNKSNVIYQINCLGCQEFYFGLTIYLFWLNVSMNIKREIIVQFINMLLMQIMKLIMNTLKS